MLINSIEIKNFRQFFGQQKIKFSTDPVKNITLIHAENGVGKTALLNAILWCFYEKTTVNFEQKKDLQNHHSKGLGGKAFFVFVEFEEDGIQYVAQRHSDSIRGGLVFRVYRISDEGVHKEIQNPEMFINSIIPKDMAEYFFFQGEGVGTLANSSGSAVREAIRDILGFTLAEETLKDIKTVKREYLKELHRLDKSSELGEVQEDLANCEESIRDIDNEIDSAEKEQEDLTHRLKQLDGELQNSNSQVVSEKHDHRVSKEKELKRLKKSLDGHLLGKRKLVGKYAISAFSGKMAQRGIDFLDEKELKGTIPAPYNVQLVEDILDKEQCICGAEIHPGTEAFGNIQELLSKASDPVLLDRVRKARSQLTGVRKNLLDAKRDFSDVLDEIAKDEESIAGVKSDLGRLSLEIQGIDFDDIKEKEQQRARLSEQLQEANKSVGGLEERRSKARELCKMYQAKEREFQSTEPQAVKRRNLIAFIEFIEAELSKVLHETEESSLSILEQKINQFLDLYVKQDFNAKIMSNFEIVLHDREDRPVGKSDGQSLLLSLTFISSLISLAKQRENASGNILTPGAVAPFVIDAPFGVLDKSYKANIAEEIPKSVNQVIFLLSSSHWEGTVETVIRGRVGREYNMVLEVAANQKEKQLSELTILGRQYDTVRYSCDADMTKIEEVGRYV